MGKKLKVGLVDVDGQDLERVYVLRDMGYSPYVMLYNKESIPQGHRLRRLQRWVNNRVIFRSCSKFEEFDRRKGGIL